MSTQQAFLNITYAFPLWRKVVWRYAGKNISTGAPGRIATQWAENKLNNNNWENSDFLSYY